MINKTDFKRRYSDIYAKIVRDAEIMNRVENRWIKKFKNMLPDERAKWLHKIMKKYGDKHISAASPLYSLLYGYCIRYCPEVYPHSREGLDMEYNDSGYLIDDSFILSIHEDVEFEIYYTLCHINCDEVVPLKIRDNVCSLIDPSGKTMLTFNDYLTFLDIRAQIKRKNAKGYKFLFNGKCINIDSLGMVDEWPRGFFDKSLNLLGELV